MKASLFNQILFINKNYFAYIGKYKRGFINKVVTHEKVYNNIYPVKKHRKESRQPLQRQGVIKNKRTLNGKITKRMTKRNNINKIFC